jgi:uncharacterized protein (DUF58 family)
MREALRALTPRGRGFLAAGLTATACGILFGERDLVRIGFLVALLPLVTAAWIARSGHRLGLARTLSAHQVETGQQSVVQLELTNVGPTTGVLLLEERIPHALGSRPRFVIDTMAPGWRRRIDYPVVADVRGRYQVGPLSVRVADPFGMVELHRTFSKTAQLVVTPRVEPLPAIRLRGAWAGSGDNRPRPFSSGNVTDVTVREYRLGDDLRRVHWRSTARVGELMVRREEQPWQARCTPFVDNRARAHQGAGSDSSLEKAVVATASVAVHLATQGFQVRLVSAAGEELGHSWHDGGMSVDPRPLLERLAVLPTAQGALHTDWVDDSIGQQLFVAVLGMTDEHDLALLSRVHATGGGACALVLDTDQWAARSAVPGPPVRTAWLQARGWKAATLGRSVPVAEAWQDLGR